MLSRIVAPEGRAPMRLKELAIAVAVVGLASWPQHARREDLGLDPGWRAGLHLAAKQRLDYGPDFAYVYGPLGFLTRPDPPYVRATWVLGIAYAAALQIALAATLYCVLRRRLTPVAAGVLAYGVSVVSVFAGPEQIQVPVIIAAVALIRGQLPARAVTIVVPALGVASGIAILGKLNGGVGVLAFSVAACLATSDRVRATATLVAIAAATTLVGWVATGNSILDLPDWVAATREIFGGYSSANQIEVRSELFHYGLLPLAMLAFAWLVFSAIRHESDRLRQAAILAIAGFFAFASFKHGFVRHSRSNGIGFFALMACAALAFTPKGRWRKGHLVAYVVLFASLGATLRGSAADTVSPITHVRSLGRDAADLVVPGRQSDNIDAWRAERRTQYGLTPPILAALEGHNVHIDPLDAGVAWAYPEIDWNPLPVFQIFTAYTVELDERNADRLRDDARAPERILRPTAGQAVPFGAGSVDGRIAEFDSPEANLEMLCRYREVAASDHWIVLARGDNRCGAPQSKGVITARLGQKVDVPAPSASDRVVVARLRGLHDSLVQSLIATVYKGAEYKIAPSTSAFDHRIVPDTAQGPLLMDGLSAFGLRAGFGFDHRIRSFAISVHNGLGFDPDSYQVEFFEIEVRS